MARAAAAIVVAWGVREVYIPCMEAMARLSADDREFFAIVARAVFLNPFSDERAEADALIAGRSGGTVSQADRHVADRLQALERDGMGRIDAFAGDDRRLVEYAWLFHFFHRYLDPLDDLIHGQLRQGDTPTPVPFARDILAELRQHGFTKPGSVRSFELFYQLRRAFHFIVKGLVGRSPSMKRLRRALWNNIFTHDIGLYERHLWNRMEDFSTLLLGETGTGKGTAAAAIGRSGCIPFDERQNRFEESFTRTFLAINLSQYPEGLIESELFGHRKGAFTGAVDHHEGVFSRGSAHGALFLDEIGEVSVPVQIKLLQVLQERTFSVVGSHEKKRFEGRVIAATNRPLDKLRSHGALRDDFFYRLSSDVITVPPLRQRLAEDPAELDDLVALTVERIVGKASQDVARMVREVLDRGLPPDYPWPGNVRELEQAVRRILLTRSYAGDPRTQGAGELGALVQGIESGAFEARELLGRYCRLLYQRFGTYEEVARRTGLDRRTAKKHIDSGTPTAR